MKELPVRQFFFILPDQEVSSRGFSRNLFSLRLFNSLNPERQVYDLNGIYDRVNLLDIRSLKERDQWSIIV